MMIRHTKDQRIGGDGPGYGASVTREESADTKMLGK